MSKTIMLTTVATAILALISSRSVVDAWSPSAFVPRHHARQLYRPSSSSSSSSSSSNTLSMKIYDWKRRTADESLLNNVEETEWTVTNLKSAPGARKRPQRKGRGISAGQGASCGFGMRGQNSRGGRPTRAGFEGGQTPLYRRLPKFVGRPTGPGHEKTIYNLVKVNVLQDAEPGSTINFQLLLEQRKVTKSKYDLHKVVMGRVRDDDGTTVAVAKQLVVQAHAFTQSAREAIEAQGGTCQLLSPTTHQVLTMAAAEEEEE